MSKTLNLSDCLLTMGRELQEVGRSREASRVLHRLVTFRELPKPILEEAHSRLADIHLAERQYRKARRHLTIVLLYQPSSARYYFLMAGALHHDPKADPERAARYYQQAINLDPEEPHFHCNYGRLLLQIGRTEEGVAELRKASEIDPDNPVIIARLVEGLCLDDRADEAQTMLRAARFRNPRDRRFRKLWNDFQFTQVASETSPARADDPVFLPFIRRAALPEKPNPVAGRILRLDPPSQPAPHVPDTARHADNRHVQ